MARVALTIAALVLAALVGLSAAAASLCIYDPSGSSTNGWSGYCGVNPAWIIEQKVASPLGKVFVSQTKATSECNKHDVSSGKPAAIAACLADKANACMLDGTPGAWVCTANLNYFFTSTPCKGTVYAEFINCNARFKSDCTGACVWQPWASSNYTQFKELDKATGGNFQTGYWCYPAKYTSKFTTTTQLRDWVKSLSPAASNTAEYVRIRGTCQYAKDGAARFAYDRVCAAYNSAQDSQLGLMYGSIPATGPAKFTGMNVTAATGCLKAGCALDYIPADVPWGYGADYFSCQPDFSRRYSLGYFGPQDTVVLDAMRACGSPSAVYNKDICLSLKL